jgi:DNA-binding response OmpR family regulator
MRCNLLIEAASDVDAAIPARIRLLCETLNSIEPIEWRDGRFLSSGPAITIHTGIATSTIALDRDAASIVVLNGTLQREFALVDLATELRSGLVLFGALYFLASNLGDDSLSDDRERIYTSQLPPPDVRGFFAHLRGSRLIGTELRLQTLARSLLRVGQLLGDLNASSGVSDSSLVSELKSASQVVREALRRAPTNGAVSDLESQLDAMQQSGELDAQGAARILTAVRSLEATTDVDSLRAALHVLANKLLLANARPASGEHGFEQITERANALRSRGLSTLKEAHARELDALLARVSLLGERTPNDPQDKNLANDFVSLARRIDPSPPAAGANALARILVVEDDRLWATRIADIVKSCGAESETARSLTAASAILERAKPTLVITDLGLPIQDDGPVELAGGLSLLQRFSAPRHSGTPWGHAFIVLTANEQIGRSDLTIATSLLRPTQFIHKGSEDLDELLRGALRSSLREGPTQKIDVFSEAPRVIHVDGSEVILEFTEWCLLAALAQIGGHRWISPGGLALKLSQDPFNLDPDSGERDEDPEAKIQARLTKYRSELNGRLTTVYRNVHGKNPVEPIVCYDGERGYQLKADVRLLTDPPYITADHRPVVLVIEDDPGWSQLLCERLRQCGFDAHPLRDMAQAEHAFHARSADVVTLDLELPATQENAIAGTIEHAAGLKLLAAMRSKGLSLPTSVLTGSRPSDPTVLSLLRAGIRPEDIVFKDDPEPIERVVLCVERNWRETLSRSRILGWSLVEQKAVLLIDRATATLLAINGYPFKAGGGGDTVLRLLARRPNKIVGRVQIIRELYPQPDAEPEFPDRSLNQHIKRVRNAIREQTDGTVDGNIVLCGGRGIYWLSGFVEYC